MSGSAPLIILLSSIIGYFFLRHGFNRTKHRWKALEWEQNVLESAALGFVFFLAARVVLITLPPLLGTDLWRPLETLGILLKSALPFPYTGSILGSILLSALAALVLNSYWTEERSHDRVIHDYGNELRRFLHYAADEGIPVALSMSDRKVYVGVILTGVPLDDDASVSLLPMISGYRDKDTLQFAFTTTYEDVYGDLIARADKDEDISEEIARFQVVLSLANVVSAREYDNDFYNRYFARNRIQPGTTSKSQQP